MRWMEKRSYPQPDTSLSSLRFKLRSGAGALARAGPPGPASSTREQTRADGGVGCRPGGLPYITLSGSRTISFGAVNF